MLSKEPIYLTLDAELKEELKLAERQMNPDITDESYERWKKEYRRTNK